ncbi:nucleotidyltransferase family protein [Acinetobacter lanii]|uniref:Nucleotidyltransferase family protein n=1 Tax=Acinetobacter lanii TaxID=2715163 RepID=A0A6G8S832_9GAMM|nr:nucleotidyltransferase family protein [Acinetobacter lanii]QIO10262.1 nucleotidyltransferase family protein [Acinetobacter lanii]
MTLSLEKHYRQQLEALILKNRMIMSILKALHSVEPNAYIAAGIIRNTVWAHLHDVEYDLNGTEVDVIFYDPDEANVRAHQVSLEMTRLYPNMQWDITNQATVHHWYIKDNGESIAPLKSIEHALSLWPETATAVAVRLNVGDQLDIVAPFGLTDLFELKLRWNPALVSYAGFIKRRDEKLFLQRWPKLQMMNHGT